jgi:hypothetical protein
VIGSIPTGVMIGARVTGARGAATGAGTGARAAATGGAATECGAAPAPGGAAPSMATEMRGINEKRARPLLILVTYNMLQILAISFGNITRRY